MIFENKLISGLFVKRYKRFFVDVKVNNKIITAHCPNTGSMIGLLKEGNTVWISKSDNPTNLEKFLLCSNIYYVLIIDNKYQEPILYPQILLL